MNSGSGQPSQHGGTGSTKHARVAWNYREQLVDVAIRFAVKDEVQFADVTDGAQERGTSHTVVGSAAAATVAQ